MIRYSSTKLESIRFDIQPSPRDRCDLLASGWEVHLYQPRLFLFRHEVRPVRLSTVASFVLPVEADWHSRDVRAAVFSD